MSQIDSLSSLVPMDSLQMPSEVRKAGKGAQETYRAAVGFETLLVKQLTETLTKSSAFGGSEDGEGGAPAAYKDMLSDNMAGAIARAGGIGIADDLYKTIRQGQGEQA